MTEEQVFLAALDLPDDAARIAYLDETCGHDTLLRRQVQALLDNHFRSGEFLNVPAVEQVDNGVTVLSEVTSASKEPGDESDDLSFLTPSTRPDSLGRIGHYEVLQLLGKGGFGIVFRAFDEILQRVVAIKVMAPHLAATSPARKRFLREARTSAAVRHENVVQVYEVGEQPLPYLVMEFIPGETLQQRLDRTGPLDVQEALRIGRQIAEGLAAAHGTDLIHRDIKPANVLLEGDQHKVKITDFGLARAADDASMTQSGTIAGTPMYMAPEQALGQTLDQRADLFSLGSVMYQMISGRAPFRANTTVAVLKRVAEDTPRNIRDIIPETPQWLCDIVTKLHAKKPEDRFHSAREVADVLTDCEAQLKANSKLQDFSRIPQIKQPAAGKSSRWRWVAAAAVLLPVLVLATWAIPFLLRYATNEGTLIYAGAIDPNLENILIKRDGQVVAKLLTSHGIVHLPAGNYEAEVVCREGYELAMYRRGPFSVLGDAPGALGWENAVGRTIPLTLTRDWDVGISLKLAKSSDNPGDTSKDESGWVQADKPGTPPPAVAPFDEDQARAHQEAWATHLGVPVEYTNNIGMKFVLIPPGKFLMGSPREEIENSLMAVGIDGGKDEHFKHWKERIRSEGPQHKVIVSKPIYLGVHEVTQAQYEQVMGRNPSHFAETGPGRDVVFGLDTSRYPVEMVSWNDAAEFCAKLSEREQLKPFYSRSGETVAMLAGTGYRLPTEAEWEYACRSGNQAVFAFGDSLSSMQANFNGNYPSGGAPKSILLNRTTTVGSYMANAFGLCDTHGNVWEWVQDGWEQTYYGQSHPKPRWTQAVRHPPERSV